MTKREFLKVIADTHEVEEMREFAAAEIEKLDTELARRKERSSAKQKENEPIMADILSRLTAEPQTSPDIAAAMELSTQKVSALLRKLVAEGKAAQSEIKIPKKGTLKAYTLA